MTVRVAAGCVALLTAGGCGDDGSAQDSAREGTAAPASAVVTSTPIKHLVVLFQENVSFDHYFGTYPKATNTDGTPFMPEPTTPEIDGLTPALLHQNPNAEQPQRLQPTQAGTCDQDHEYADEQKAFNGGAMDKFVEHTEVADCTKAPRLYGRNGLVMDYYDGNTVTGLWNYAQHYAMSDNSFGTVFGPSTPGALNLVSGQTHGGHAVTSDTHQPTVDPSVVASVDAAGVGTAIEDPDPAFDDCSNASHTTQKNLLAMSGRNIGDLLNDNGVSWGWFQGGFRPTSIKNDLPVCGAKHMSIAGQESTDYNPHHEPFQYFQSTSNPKHLPPASATDIGQSDQANHQYDLTDFDTARTSGNLPSVSFLKAPNYQDGHAGYSDPLDEQRFIVDTINKLQSSPEWSSTAVVIAYDDSDGWYDHKTPDIINGSQDQAVDDPALCGSAPVIGGYADRCGYGPRLPLLVISPFSKVNSVDHTRTDQTSILKLIEDNWNTGRIGDSSFDEQAGSLAGLFDFAHPHNDVLTLDPGTGAVR
ncbi:MULTISPECIES: phospholipase C [unclassified Rhodococcus (in: high G+C Gram-positive bacteria)]|uniref:phospholipase C n=1 Tax=unclassified Rhodococcus (in: high G+C Gram-positive bacteria) TaxID=192944 RepID=UPI00163A7C09|nr:MULTISPECIES: alkaline phosphatase family protein [unclassified Rhodococcus (in: high G+C Gram-positive bacteria)]MBC2638248.1 alkaline phosphatase family protein [Rhodococcus sp. 3A]MBC2897010.1 alkaline phosphatase family protein [Rhodococcus sp. 4CII]